LEGTRLRELSFQNSMEFPTGRVTQTLAGNNSEARGSTITTLATTLATRILGANSEVNLNFILNTLASVMGRSPPAEQSEKHMEIEEVSQPDSPLPPAPVPAPSSQQDATLSSAVCSTSTSSPASKPVELQLAAGEEQGILSGDHPAGLDEEDSPILALPRALVARQYWVSGATSRKISKACGELGNRICHQCRRKFSSTRRLRVHVPQHFLIVFCPCGEYSYQHDYVLRHQRISRCHTGYTFAVNQATFPEFWDLVMPHVADPRRRAVLAQGFPRVGRSRRRRGSPSQHPNRRPSNHFGLCWHGSDRTPGPIPRTWSPTLGDGREAEDTCQP